MEGLPGSVYGTQALSAIHWQPWTRDTLDLAKQSNKLIVAVIALPQQPSFVSVLNALGQDEETVSKINDVYIPVLIDGDAIREMGVLSADLCSEIGSALQLPLMIWMTPDASPVAWIPLPPNSNERVVLELFAQSDGMVGRMWEEDPSYVMKNSKIDQANRRKRMLDRQKNYEFSVEPAEDSVRALRQLTSLYDPVSRTFDEAGGLFPCGAIDLLAMGSRTASLPESLREKCRETLGYLMDDILVSAMFDPLDGGVFSSRRGMTWSLPGFQRDCSTQARIVVSLLDAYEITGDSRALDRALGVIGFIESEYAVASGMFSLGGSRTSETESWLWRFEDVEEILSVEELELWAAATGIKSMGNLPSEVDPAREFFRANSIGFVKSAADLAVSTGRKVDEISALLDSARRKLFKARDERLDFVVTAKDANAAASFRMVSAYASAFRITGNKEYFEKARKTLNGAKEKFSRGPKLTLYIPGAEPSLVAGRAFLYGLALQAALDLWSVGLDEKWLFWADDLATTATELFLSENYLREYPAEADFIGLPITDFAMLFDESTAGLFSLAQTRLEGLGRPLLPALSKEVAVLPIAALNSPILHTDLIQASLVREHGITYVFPQDISGEMRASLLRSPFKGVNRRPASSAPEHGGNLKSGELLKIEANSNSTTVNGLQELPDSSLRNP